MPATGLTLVGPQAPSLNVPSANYVVELSPEGSSLSGTVTVTPAATVPGTFVPAAVVLTPTVPSAFFSFVPTGAVGDTGQVSLANTGGLSNPPPVALTVVAAAGAMFPLPGDAVVPVRGTKISSVPGTVLTILHTAAHLPRPLASATLYVKQSDNVTVASLTKAGLLMDPGTLAADGSYTALVVFALTTTDTETILPSNGYRAGVHVVTVAGDPIETTYKNSWEGISGAMLG